MKKIIIAAVAIAVFASYNVYHSNSETEKAYNMALENVEAMAGLEDGPTRIEQCTNKVLTQDTGIWFLECDSRTTGSLIYSCPVMPKEGGRTDWYYCRK